MFFGVTPEDYEDLALLFADIRRWVEETYWQLEYYRGIHDGNPEP